MISNDIVDAVRRKAAVATIAIAGASLTDDQLDLLAVVLSGKSAREIKAMFNAVLPAQHDRTGILLPYMTSGRLAEYPARVHDLVVFILGQYYLPAGKASDAAVMSGLTGANSIRNGAPPNKSVGSREMTGTGDARELGPSPTSMRTLGSLIPPSVVWSTSGLSPNGLSVGFAGMEELKGNLPDSGGAHPDVRAYRDAPSGSGRPPLVHSANAEAEKWLESEETP